MLIPRLLVLSRWQRRAIQSWFGKTMHNVYKIFQFQNVEGIMLFLPQHIFIYLYYKWLCMDMIILSLFITILKSCTKYSMIQNMTKYLNRIKYTGMWNGRNFLIILMVLIRRCMSGISYAYWYYDITLLKLTITFSIVLPFNFLCTVWLILYQNNNDL